MKRREFLEVSAAASAIGLGFRAKAASERDEVEKADRPLALLILGGTGFLGPHIVERALARGHSMTLFNRGRTNPHLFPDLEKLVGDRDPDKDAGLSALEGRRFDAVIDTSGYYPRAVRASAELLDASGQYVFVSSVSVYASLAEPGVVESAPLGTLDDPSVEEVNGETYGPLKALCEQAAEQAMPGRTTVVRPGLIVGPGDPTDRFTYWPVRVQRGGEILCPGDPRDPVQVIDARDLANWVVNAIEARTTGTFNAVGPLGRMGIAELIHGCRAVTGTDCTFAWADADFLEAREVSPWGDMPAWVPPRDDYAGFGLVSNQQALATGLHLRPLADTISDTLDWFGGLPEERRSRLRAGIALEREAEVLAELRGRA